MWVLRLFLSDFFFLENTANLTSCKYVRIDYFLRFFASIFVLEIINGRCEKTHHSNHNYFSFFGLLSHFFVTKFKLRSEVFLGLLKRLDLMSS
jgi:hypothetical protein